MDEDVVLLKATCRSCGRTAEIGYIHGRARVTVTAFHCEHCGTKSPSTPQPPPSPATPPRKRIGPKPSSRLKAARGTLL